MVQGNFTERDVLEWVRIIVGKEREKKNWGHKITSVAYYFDYYRFVTHFDMLGSSHSPLNFFVCCFVLILWNYRSSLSFKKLF